MKAEVLNAFLHASINCLAKETQAPVRRLGLTLDANDQVSHDVNVYVAFVGTVRGNCFISMERTTARKLVGRMLGEEERELSEMAFSALAEIGNLIAGGACMTLDRMGHPCDITPPGLMIGNRSRVSTLGLPRFIIPLETCAGQVDIQVAIDIISQ